MALRDEPNLRFKIPHNGITKNQQKSMPRETEKHSLINLMIGGGQTNGTSLGGKDQDGHGMMKSEGFLTQGWFAPMQRIEEFFKMVME